VDLALKFRASEATKKRVYLETHLLNHGQGIEFGVMKIFYIALFILQELSLSTLSPLMYFLISYTVENMWVQSRLVEGRLVVLAVRGGIAPL
jgi:hypothetical protein